MTTYQDAKDSFYMALRDRLAALNADRVCTVRGAQRPAVLVAENELESGDGTLPVETFVLHWGATALDSSDAMPLEHARCTLRFHTVGSPELAGMDRGRMMSAMRTELAGMLQPSKADKKSYAGAAVTTARTPVFWTAVIDEALTETDGDLQCVCGVEVFAWKEEG